MRSIIGYGVAVVAAVLITVGVRAAEEAHHDETAGKMVTVTGEVVDMACYLDHGAYGAKHAGCAKTCIESGLPVGIKGQDGKTYLLIGEHKPVNKEFAPLAAKTVTVHGKLTSRDGINLLSDVEVVK